MRSRTAPQPCSQVAHGACARPCAPAPALTVAAAQRGYRVRALSRSAGKAAQLLGAAPGLELVYGDLKDGGALARVTDGVDAVACCTGTTAFPSKRCGRPRACMP
jgi:uncharacterized protein YbjT (DUF2867 family)